MLCLCVLCVCVCCVCCVCDAVNSPEVPHVPHVQFEVARVVVVVGAVEAAGQRVAAATLVGGAAAGSRGRQMYSTRPLLSQHDNQSVINSLKII